MPRYIASKTAENTIHGNWVSYHFQLHNTHIQPPHDTFPIFHFTDLSLSLPGLCFQANAFQCITNAVQYPLSSTFDTDNFKLDIEFKPIKKAPNAIWLAQNQNCIAAIMAAKLSTHKPRLMLLESEIAFFFQACPSPYLVSNAPAYVTASMPLLNDWHIPNRLCCPSASLPGCYEGHAQSLADLLCQNDVTLQQIHLQA